MNLAETMKSIESRDLSICIVGLGYVGLPLVAAFSKHISVMGVDIDEEKVEFLKKGIDPNGELPASSFNPKDILFTTDIKETEGAVVYIVTVPTPITKNNTPNLEPLRSASEMVGQVLKKGDVVIFESTVYPGCTEEVCIPLLEEHSELRAIDDFKVGYSPERINPGDKVHTLSNTIKIVSGIDDETLAFVSKLYRMIIEAGVHEAASLKVAEAAKIVENVQRDLNIALMNELSLIFDRMDIETQDVVQAAGTKWNFHKYYPGLVGGHCISVDPYYLTYKAQELGYDPEVILSGRKVNDNVSSFIANKIIQHLGQNKINLASSRVLVMGVTFKENVSDIRNSKVIDLINKLSQYNINTQIIDPYASSDKVEQLTGIKQTEEPEGKYDCIVVAVQHNEFKSLTQAFFDTYLSEQGLLIDIKGIFRNQFDHIETWTL